MAPEDPLLLVVSRSSDIDPLNVRNQSQTGPYNRIGRPTISKAIKFCPQPKSMVSQLLSNITKNPKKKTKGSSNDNNLQKPPNNVTVDTITMPSETCYQTAGVASELGNLNYSEVIANSLYQTEDVVFSEDDVKCKKVKCKITKPQRTCRRKLKTSNSRECSDTLADVCNDGVSKGVPKNSEYWCDTDGCNYKSNVMTNLTKHKRIHSNERPYMCEKCPFRSNYVNSLKAHRRIHTSEWPYCCHQCGYRCNSTSNLKKHFLLKHANDLKDC